MGACINQGLIFKMLIPLALNRIDRKDWALKVKTHPAGHWRTLKIITHALLILMIEGITP